MKRSYKILLYIIVPVFVFAWMGLFAQYLTDDEDIEISIKKPAENTNSGAKGMPDHLAYGIKAEKATDLKNAAAISFMTNQTYLKEFIVGRSNEMIDSKDRVLAAVTVKEVLGRDKNVVIDTDLKPGKYYYVVMAREKLLARTIELFKDVNYTTVPVVIEAEPRDRALDIVTMLRADKISENKIALSWKRPDVLGLLYTVYRSKGVIDTVEKLSQAEKAGIVVDKDSFTDAEAVFRGTYYYAVTVKEVNGRENTILRQGQNYTVAGIVVEENVKAIVTGLNVKTDGVNAFLEWNPAVSKTGMAVSEYVIYRSPIEIAHLDALQSSLVAGNVRADTKTYKDANLQPGKYFYAVLVKLSDGMIDQALKRGQNFTSAPVEIKEPYTLKSINAVWSSGKVIISWNFSGASGDKNFRLFRAPNMLNSVNDIDKKWFYMNIDVTQKRFADERPYAGEYFYGIVPHEKHTPPDYKLLAGVNITAEAVGSPIIPGPSEDKSKIETDGLSSDDKSGSEDKTVIIDEKIVPPEGDKKKHEAAGPDRVEPILQKYFFNRYYKSAIKELQNVANNTDNIVESAKAKLFIARSHIELGEYSKALEYIIAEDVVKYFPSEAEFWKEFALLRIR